MRNLFSYLNARIIEAHIKKYLTMNISKKEMQQKLNSKSSLPSNSRKDHNKKKSSSKTPENKCINGHYTKFSLRMFKADFPKFVKEIKDDPYSFECLKCQDDKQRKVIFVNNLFRAN